MPPRIGHATIEETRRLPPALDDHLFDLSRYDGRTHDRLATNPGIPASPGIIIPSLFIITT
jgi:hypothetical protein